MGTFAISPLNSTRTSINKRVRGCALMHSDVAATRGPVRGACEQFKGRGCILEANLFLLTALLEIKSHPTPLDPKYVIVSRAFGTKPMRLVYQS